MTAVIYCVRNEIKRLKNEVAVLLALNRTRLEKSRWRSIQTLLQDSVFETPDSVEFRRNLLRERDYLQATIEDFSRKDAAIKDAAIMSRRML
jgi:hypothetical protein